MPPFIFAFSLTRGSAVSLRGWFPWCRPMNQLGVQQQSRTLPLVLVHSRKLAKNYLSPS
jgi:hypothetical protein